MEQDLPLSSLAKIVAATRARGLMSRLVVRNLERFGLVHLYFERGRLAHVEGHLGDPLHSLADLSGWVNGTIRQDSVAFADTTMVLDSRLDLSLDQALRALTVRGVVEPASPLPATGPLSAAPDRGSRPAAGGPASVGTGGLPPLSGAGSAEQRQTNPSATGLVQRERLTPPQWQLVALVIRQMVERMGQLIGPEMAESLLRQALVLSARSNPVLHDLEVESFGWLKETHEAAMSARAAEDVAEAVAALVTNFEFRCASLMGKEQAHHIIASTADPFRTALAQIGLDVSD